MTTYEVAVIGGGLSGFIAAIDVARSGKSVVLLEKSNQVGGRAITINKNGALFNLGGHALYRGGEVYPILQELGVKLEGGVPPTQGFAIWNNSLVPMPGDPLKLLSSKLLSWSGKIELGRFMLKLGKMDTVAMSKTSLRAWAEQEIHDPMVRHIFYALCRTSTYAKEIDHQLASSVILQVQRALKSGVVYLHGGWQTIVDQLRERAIQAGVTILNNTSVTEIVVQEGRVHGLHFANGSRMDIRHVITTTAPADTYRLVADADHTQLRRWKDEARPVMAACLDLGLKRLPVANRHFAIGLDQPIFFTHHSRVAKLSDNGTWVMHLIKYNSADECDPKADERLLEQTMNLLHPGWQKEVVAKQFLPNMTVVHDYMHIGRSGLPGPSVPEIRGLYVAGDWASHGEMLADAAAASARRASKQVLQDLTNRHQQPSLVLK